MSWKLHEYESDPQLTDQLAVTIGENLQAGIASRDQASLAVSGGSTPRGLFARLAEIDIDWGRVCITLVDERWVDENHPDSNARLVKEQLLKNRASYARFLPLKTASSDPFSSEKEVSEALGKLMLPLDVVVLGMGSDGHTASFFAGARGVDQALNLKAPQLACAVEPITAPHPRMTLTLPTILSARHCYLHIIGDDKKQVLNQAIADGAGSSFPIANVLHQATITLQIYYAKSGAKQ